MSDLTKIEKLKLEKIFDMSAGYVLNFSNKTFGEFIIESTKLDIYEEKYSYGSGSKANRLRAFWDKESNYTVSKLISDMLELRKTNNLLYRKEPEPNEKELHNECLEIINRLKKNSGVENIEVFQQNKEDKDFDLLANLIRESISKGQPESALDRLHTFMIKYIKKLCDKHELDSVGNKPLHSLLGEYIKYLKHNKLIESDMTERILKSSISILEAFNSVRNNKSFAHDNNILNYNESLLILNNVTNLVNFINSIEDNLQNV